MESLGYDDTTNPVVTPGLKPLREQLEGDKPLPQGKHTQFRGNSARGNYLSADRPDV